MIKVENYTKQVLDRRSSPQKGQKRKPKMGFIIKENEEGMGILEDFKPNLIFKSTTREQEEKRHLPDNGPSPGAHQFNPSYKLVHQKLKSVYNSTQVRFPNDLDYNFMIKKKLHNPRFDRNEGLHSLMGKNPDCGVCNKRIELTEK